MIKMKKVSVLLPSNTNSTYDYLSPSSLELGTLVSVPFRNKEMKGIVWYDSSAVSYTHLTLPTSDLV